MNQVIKGQLILLTIKRMGINGEGIGFYKRQTIFVNGALPGEIVEVEIKEVNPNYAVGVVTKFKKKSPYRTNPRCGHFEQCQCSDLQHLAYDQQLGQKQQLLLESLERYVDSPIEKTLVLPIIKANKEWQTRTYLNLPTRHDGEKVVVGMYERGSNRLVYIDNCYMYHPFLQEKLQEILDYLTKANISIYNPRYNQGSLRNIILRICPRTKESMLIAVLFEKDPYLIKVLKKLSNITSINYVINEDEKSQTIDYKKIVHLTGKKYIDVIENKIKYKILPSSFYFPNVEETNNYLLKLINNGYIAKNDNVVSIYSSLGTHELLLKPYVKEIVGFEEEPFLVENTIINIQNENIKFLSGNIVENLYEISKTMNIDCLIITPPRSGIDSKLLNAIKTLKIKKIIYISQNPSTFAKNISHLQRQYQVKFIQPIDSHPQTIKFSIVAGLKIK